MRILPLLLVSLLTLTACAPEPDFHVDLTLVDEELSEDSNSQTQSLVIEGSKGTYTWLYEGYYPHSDFEPVVSHRFELTEEQIHDLTLLIRENGLMVSRSESVSTGESWSAFDLTWEVSMSGQSASGHVAGEASDGQGPSEPGSGVRSPDESYFAAQEIMYYVQDLLGL